MDEPPGNVDDLQPQDLSTSSLPAVIDLTRRGEECVLSPTSLDALRRVTSSAWYQNSGTSSAGFSETSSAEVTPQPGDQIQPDNAFSHTTVTLSYVSRSHVFPSHDSLSFSVSPISRLSLHPPCDSDKGLRETNFALNQHYQEQVEGPVDLAAQTLLHSLSQAPQGSGSDEGVSQEGQEFNGGGVSGDRDEEERGEEEQRGCWGLENGKADSWSGSGVCTESSPETLPPAGGRAETSRDPEVIFLFSKDQVPGMAPGSVGVQDLSREYISPLDDPVSPSAASQDDVEDVFILPQASSSPSGDASYLETPEEAAWDSPGTEGGSQPPSDLNDGSRFDPSAENKQGQEVELHPLIDLTEEEEEEEEEKTPHTAPLINGSSKALRRTLKGKRLPARSGRGMRLEAIVMNINSSRFKVARCIRTNKKTSPSSESDSKFSGPQRTQRTQRTQSPQSPSAAQRKRRGSVSPTAKTKGKSKALRRRRRRSKTDTHDNCKDSTSDPDLIHNSNRSAVHRNAKKEAELLPHAQPSIENHVATFSPPQKTTPPPPPSTPSPKKHKGKAAGKKTPPTAKATPPQRKRRRKKLPPSRSASMFAPKEPEIKLKYVTYKEEKRELRSDSFSPFVRVKTQLLSPSLCSVVNYPEEVKVQHRKQPHAAAAFLSAAVPSTSCLQLGRVSMHGQHRRSLVCCLCGHAANAMDLGDLHGPYYPEGYQLRTKTPGSLSGLKEEEDFSDSDSSSCSVRGRGRKCPSTLRPPRPGAHLKSPRWTGDSTSSPAAKRARSGSGSVDVEDWYSPPVLPVEPCEFWLHEDCGIWSTGVFLVRGRVYGLEEAVRAAQETTCSACQDSGATLGCVFKGCPNKYHYRCALQADCVLIEENFSMKCKKHKNKTFRAPAGTRGEDR